MIRTDSKPSFSMRYGLAVGSVAAAFVGTKVLSGLGDSGISPLFFAAVMVSAWYGGRAPGLLATGLSGIGTTYLLMADREWTAAAVRDDIFRVTVFTVVALITSSLHAATLRAKRSAESASAAKSQFLAMVSHELLTPLSPVLMAVEMLLDDHRLPPSVRTDLELIARNINLQTRLINDLLDFSRINNGKMQMRWAATDVHQSLCDAVELCRGEVDDREQVLSLNLVATHSTIHGDALRLQQVFWNLLRNATKFTPHGGHIRVSSRNEVESIIVAVEDDGIGISPKRLCTIFDPFDQGDAEVRIQYGGLGLGLAIGQAMTQSHHGKIDVYSEGPGRGARFEVKLPLVTVPSEATSAADVEPNPLISVVVPS